MMKIEALEHELVIWFVQYGKWGSKEIIKEPNSNTSYFVGSSSFSTKNHQNDDFWKVPHFLHLAHETKF